jgi:glycosyltransferase involved in cell wall biosynthesis
MTSRSTTPLAVAWDAVARPKTSATPPSLRVYMMDLLSIVPYYTGHLCAELQKLQSPDLTLGSIQYGHDPTFFKRIGVATDRALFDFGSSLPRTWNRLRRAVKGSENLLNLLLLALRFLVRKPDVLHVQFLPLLKQGIPIELWFVQFVRSLGTRVVYTVHNVLPHESADRDREMFQQIYRQADLLICHDQPAKARLIAEFGIAPERVVVIPHGPMFSGGSQSDPAQAREDLGLPQEGCLVLFQGIIRPYKGVSFLLQSWKRAVEQGLRGTLLIVGTGEAKLLAAIEKEVNDLGIQPSVRLEFRFVSLSELDTYYKAADVLVFPYGAVTTSGALLTCTGYGKPIVATALPAFQEILRDEHNALLVPSGDQAALANALKKLAGDSELRARLAQQLRANASALPTWPVIAQQTAQWYARLASRTVAVSA